MVPQPATEVAATPRELRRKRLERLAFGGNGVIFLINAWGGIDTGGPRLGIAANLIFGLVQLAALVRSGSRPLPERLAYGLAAAGLFVSAGLAIHHRTGIVYAYALAGSLNLVLAMWGPERIRAWVRRNRTTLEG